MEIDKHDVAVLTEVNEENVSKLANKCWALMPIGGILLIKTAKITPDHLSLLLRQEGFVILDQHEFTVARKPNAERIKDHPASDDLVFQQKFKVAPRTE